ncbi:MAG: 3-dehydroquinate synthase, partial [Clostridia bacterium]
SETVENSLQTSGFDVLKYVIKNGEKSKNLDNFCKILNYLAENAFTRTDLVVALGGGVVGDLAGFSAASYMRGIDFVQVPTTILAQIDSSVGGKTGVDLDSGKNLVGAFWQPKFVLCDIETTKTLPVSIFDDGLGEMAKYGILCDENFFEIVAENDLPKNLTTLIIKSIEYKRDIVEIDEFEKNERKFLNLGHTVAHGIEKLSGFEISHGKAVGMGLYSIADASKKNDMIDEKTYSKIISLLQLLHQTERCPYSIDEIFSTMALDKKCEGKDITLVLIEGIGRCVLKKMEIKKAKEFLA